jgi:hypothetical protein
MIGYLLPTMPESARLAAELAQAREEEQRTAMQALSMLRLLQRYCDERLENLP